LQVPLRHFLSKARLCTGNRGGFSMRGIFVAVILAGLGLISATLSFNA
jgi:hypothetical protein